MTTSGQMETMRLIDNTYLNREGKDTDREAIKQLLDTSIACGTAAVCVYPEWVHHCKQTVAGTSVKVATVVNFPLGVGKKEDVVKDVEDALKAGADEIDLVIDYRLVIDNCIEGCRAISKLCSAVKEVCGGALLKTIIEVGELRTKELVQAAARAAVDGGSDVVKTSTGKVEVNSTPEFARWILEAVPKHIGIKCAGGIKTANDVEKYRLLVLEMRGEEFWNPTNFRIGASSLVNELRGETGNGAPSIAY